MGINGDNGIVRSHIPVLSLPDDFVSPRCFLSAPGNNIVRCQPKMTFDPLGAQFGCMKFVKVIQQGLAVRS
jgi:hypothetical protein